MKFKGEKSKIVIVMLLCMEKHETVQRLVPVCENRQVKSIVVHSPNTCIPSSRCNAWANTKTIQFYRITQYDRNKQNDNMTSKALLQGPWLRNRAMKKYSSVGKENNQGKADKRFAITNTSKNFLELYLQSLMKVSCPFASTRNEIERLQTTQIHSY